ncbi:hypothetical protein JCM3766R1_006619 [Sporobolomyces carnicolor]
MDQDDATCTRVAVIGSGLAGLTAAHVLSVVPSDVQVHVFEKSEELGMDNSSISIKGEKGSYRIDVPMRSINTGSHDRVKKLYDYLKVPLVKNEFSYSFSRLASTRSAAVPPSESSACSTGVSSRTSTPLPPYSEEPSVSTTAATRRAPSSGRAASRSRSPRPSPPPFPTSTTTLIYEGSSGLRWPPVSLPTSLSTTTTSSLPALVRSTWRQSVYIVQLVFLAVSYLHILLLSFFYVKFGLTQRRKALRLPLVGTIENVGGETLESWCHRHGVHDAMREQVLVPLMAAVCTVGVEDARTMPVGEALEYIASTFLSAHYTTAPSFGVRGIVRRLIAPVQVSNIYLSSQIQEITHNDRDTDLRPYTIKYRIGAEEGDREVEAKELDVDYIVFATQANQAAFLLDTLASSARAASPDLAQTIAALNSFRYVQALVVNHTDHSFLPPNPLDRRDLNLAAFSSHAHDNPDEAAADDGVWTTHLPPSSVETTHIVSSASASSASSRLPAVDILQTTNPLRPVRPSRVLSSSWFSRAFVTAESKQVLPRFLLQQRSSHNKDVEGGLQGLMLGSNEEADGRSRRGGIYFTGSWCERGIPLLEGCVTSAENVAKNLLEREGVKVGKKNWPF